MVFQSKSLIATGLVVAEAKERLHVINACGSEPVWIAATSNSGLADSVLIEAGGKHDFDVDSVPSGQRYWPKFGCDSDGQKCSVGDSGGPGQICGDVGCAPPVDSKFEITVNKDDNIDWWDTSAVDGFSVPFKVELEGCGTQSPNIDCSSLSLDDCPEEDIQGVGKISLKLLDPKTQKIAGCYSPCAKLTTRNYDNVDGTHTPSDPIAEPYCCPTLTPEECRAGPSATMQFTKSIHANCPHTYAYSYDDADGLHTCPTGTEYTWTVYCPGGATSGQNHTDVVV